MNDFWASRLAPLQPAEPTTPRGDGAAYRAERRAVSASMIYTENYVLPEQRPHLPQQRYVDGSRPLDSYKQAPTSKWARRDDESANGYVARLRGASLVDTSGALSADQMSLLSEGDREAIAASWVAIETAEGQDGADAWKAHRARVDQHAAEGAGQQQLGHRVAQDQRFENRQIEKLGHLAHTSINGANVASRSDIAAALRADEQNRQADYRAALAASTAAIASRIAGN